MVYIIYFVIFFTPALTNGQEKEYVLYLRPQHEIPASIQKKYHQLNGDSLYITAKLNQLISEFYELGYLAASIDQVNFEEDTVIAQLYCGKKYYQGTIDHSNLEPLIKEQTSLRNHRNKKNIFRLSEILSIKENILSAYENAGYPFVALNFKPVQFDDSLINLKINIIKNNLYCIDSIIVKGEAKISPHYLYRYLQIYPGDVFNQKKINQIEKRIESLNFLSSIKPAEIEFKTKNADLYLYLKKQKANTFNGIIGFLPENETTGKLLVTGELNLNLINSFGRGEDLFFRWEKLESSTQKLDVRFRYPYLLKTNLGVDGNFELYKKDSSYLSLHSGIGLRLMIDYNKSLRGYYRYKNSSRIGSNLPSTGVQYADVKSNIFGVSFHFMQLDYKLNPQKGVALDIFGGAGFKNLGNTQQITDSLNINPDHNLVEIDAGLDFKFYFPIYNRFVFYFSNTTRYLDQFADKGEEAIFFENELYQFGGASSLRGFDENIFNASVYSLQNIEIRYLFEQNSAFYLFWNGAYYYKNVTQKITEDFPWGFGIGADFETNAGIFTISYALGKQFDNPIEISSAKIHIGYVSRF
ncbi:MAG: POTRA domain-containing protein [Thiohalospira sp.]